MKFFGTWGSAEAERCERPVGKTCLYCHEEIGPDDLGALVEHAVAEAMIEEPWHRECFIRSIFGSVAHQSGTCSCGDGTTPEIDDGRNLREQARDAAAVFDARRQPPQ